MFYGEAVEGLLSTQRWLYRMKTSPDFATRSAATKNIIREGIHLLPMCKPFFWATDPTNAVLLASEVYPLDIPFSRDLLYCDFGWCWFQRPPFDTPDKTGTLYKVQALMWAYGYQSEHLQSYNEDRIQTYHEAARAKTYGLQVITINENLNPVGSYSVLEGEPLITDDVTDNEPNRLDPLRFVLSAGAWLRQRILTAHEERPNHQTRKTIKREIGRIDIPNIQVVQLRRTASAPHDSASVSERDWHCQWMVRGHWRNQYYASSGDHMPKYIHPYIKGPEDKPLKPPSGEIFAVTR